MKAASPAPYCNFSFDIQDEIFHIDDALKNKTINPNNIG